MHKLNRFARRRHLVAKSAISLERENEEVARLAHGWANAVFGLGPAALRANAEILGEFYHDELAGERKVVPAEMTAAQLRQAAAVIRADRMSRRVPALEKRVGWLADLIGLDPVERRIDAAVVRRDTDPAWERLFQAVAARRGYRSLTPLATILDMPAAKLEHVLAPHSPLCRFGLVERERDGDVSAMQLLQYIAYSAVSTRAQLVRLVSPEVRRSTLRWDDFEHLGEQADLARRIVSSGEGCSILLYGQPGTGKTEFACLLAAQVGARACFVGQSDDDGREPTRNERIGSLLRAQIVTRRDPSRILVMDEADDVLVLGGGSMRAGSSKLWLNRLVETVERPTIWIVNSLAQLDEAIVRRMDLVMRLDRPSRAVRERIVRRHARREKLALPGGDVAALADLPLTPATLGKAVRAARLSGGAGEEALMAGRAMTRALTGREATDYRLPAVYDPALALADRDLSDLADRLLAAPESGWSLLLSGPSGTGKSAYARHLAQRLDIEVIEKRGSDLLGAFVGETEANMAAAFAQAAGQGAMLLIDEADDFLSDRRDAVRGWERAMVNEMLRQMDALRAPFLATTNFADRLDPATRRRFTMQATFRTLDEARARALFAHSFGVKAPVGARLENLTPGDFGLTARRASVLGERDAVVLLGWLRVEAQQRVPVRAAAGFR